MLARVFLSYAFVHVYLVTDGSAFPNNYLSQGLDRIKRSVIYDQNNDWDSIKLKGKDLVNEIKKVVHKRWKGVVDQNEKAKQVDNVLFSLRCKMNEIKDQIYNLGPIKYMRDIYDEIMYYKDYFNEQYERHKAGGK